MYKTPESRWRAVQIRDRAAASAFVYAVTTTHIFCRPVCPARLVRRANVRFFDTPAEAAAAQFRPCKRCKPQDSDSAEPAAKKVVEAACTKIREQHGQITLDALANYLHISPRYLHHIFSKNVGCTPATYAAKFKSKLEQSLAVQQTTSPLQPSTASNTNTNINNSGYMATAVDTSTFVDSLDQWAGFEDSTVSSATWSDLENMDATTNMFCSQLPPLPAQPTPLPLPILSPDVIDDGDSNLSWQIGNCTSQDPSNFWDFANYTDFDSVFLVDSDLALPTT